MYEAENPPTPEPTLSPELRAALDELVVEFRLEPGDYEDAVKAATAFHNTLVFS